MFGHYLARPGGSSTRDSGSIPHDEGAGRGSNRLARALGSIGGTGNQAAVRGDWVSKRLGLWMERFELFTFARKGASSSWTHSRMVVESWAMRSGSARAPCGGVGA